jgi:4-hydroxythreonine-4-phosphate dehydrogenase
MTVSAPGRGAIPLALTMGEPAGIGGEIAIKAWSRRNEGVPPFLLVDDAERLSREAGRLGLTVPIQTVSSPAEAAEAFASALPVLSQPLSVDAVPGKLDEANTLAVRRAIETAVDLTLGGEAAAVVTNPIQKQTLYDTGFPFPGHTEFLAHLARIDTPAVMMLACPELRVVPVTVHMSLRNAVMSLKFRNIIQAAMITDQALRLDFGIAKPRLAVAGLNPHAGEGGALGTEEAEIIQPAVAELLDRGLDVFGPAPPDTLFGAKARTRYDAAICMYHDQALLPIKTLAFDSAVNITLGLPFVRTSPDHGTALDIAGQGKADEASLVAALKMAAEVAERRHLARALSDQMESI